MLYIQGILWRCSHQVHGLVERLSGNEDFLYIRNTGNYETLYNKSIKKVETKKNRGRSTDKPKWCYSRWTIWLKRVDLNNKDDLHHEREKRAVGKMIAKSNTTCKREELWQFYPCGEAACKLRGSEDDLWKGPLKLWVSLESTPVRLYGHCNSLWSKGTSQTSPKSIPFKGTGDLVLGSLHGELQGGWLWCI